MAPPLPGSSPVPPQGPGTEGISGLVPPQDPGALSLGPTPEQKVQAFMEQIRDLHMTIDGLTTQHPEAADEFNEAKNALTNSMSKVVSAMSSPEGGPQPMTF
mgnify:CR=1 FL=1